MRMPQSRRTTRSSSVISSGASSEDGQVLLEYVLMLSVAIALLIGVQRGFRGSIFRVWKQFAVEISAACPKGCVRSSSIQ